MVCYQVRSKYNLSLSVLVSVQIRLAQSKHVEQCTIYIDYIIGIFYVTCILPIIYAVK